ncbi:MAG: hypothetical protein JXM74_06705 [Fusobacteriaceae bacterium]|nr:hypothetical protein [Fusobacteriaceae bacterium]MBN2838431.1 hypothetical protein [Fusobacteriaceae bacterium]
MKKILFLLLFVFSFNAFSADNLSSLKGNFDTLNQLFLDELNESFKSEFDDLVSDFNYDIITVNTKYSKNKYEATYNFSSKFKSDITKSSKKESNYDLEVIEELFSKNFATISLEEKNNKFYLTLIEATDSEPFVVDGSYSEMKEGLETLIETF